MANYIPHARTNYFRVKDAEAFKSFVANIGAKIIQKKVRNEILYGMIASPGFSWETYNGIEDDNNQTFAEIDIFEETAKHLVDGDVAIFQEVGCKRMRYFVGYSLAINSKFEIRTASIHDIYDKAQQLGKNISSCSN